MVQLAPVPFDALIGRMFRELEEKRSVFDLPAQRFVQAYPGRDLSVAFGERRASTPFGPAAGPHTQMAQNIALSWLAGGRVIECKTVQVNDAIEVPRPCIDMATVGFNIEWSQELTVAQSLEEYVKGAMLIEMLKASGVGAGLGDTVFDMSVGYDLAGIRSAKVRGFLDGMLDARALVDRLRAQIPARFRKFRDLAFPTRISELADAVDLPRLPAERNRGDRQASDRRGRPRRRRQAQPDFARPRRTRFDPAREARLSRHRRSLSGRSPRTRPGARLRSWSNASTLTLRRAGAASG